MMIIFDLFTSPKLSPYTSTGGPLMNHISKIIVVAGLTSLGAGCVNNDAAETITREDYGRIATEMREAVDSGWLSEEEMTSKLGELRMQIAPRTNDDRRTSREAIKTRLGAIEEKVASGEMSREDADENIAKVRRRIAAGRAEQAEESRTFTRAEYARAKKKMDGMVKAGEASQEDVDTRLGQMRRMISKDRGEQGEESRTFTRSEYARAKKKIDGMVLAGEVSQEDADRRLARMRHMIVPERREGDDVNWDGLKRRIEAAAEAGDLTDEALEGIKKRIEGAVEAGGMTREEADALYEKLEKSE